MPEGRSHFRDLGCVGSPIKERGGLPTLTTRSTAFSKAVLLGDVGYREFFPLSAYLSFANVASPWTPSVERHRGNKEYAERNQFDARF